MRLFGFSIERTDEEKLLNIGIPVTVGGCGPVPKPPRTIYVREPSLEAITDFVKKIVDTMTELSDTERVWTEKAIANPHLVDPRDIAKVKPIVAILEGEMARVVGESVEWCRKEIGPSQATAIGAAWVSAVGIRRIRDFFFQIRSELRAISPAREPETSRAPYVDERLSAKD